jgi:hypothetical protein
LARRVTVASVDDHRSHLQFARHAGERHRDLSRAHDDERQRWRDAIDERAFGRLRAL